MRHHRYLFQLALVICLALCCTRAQAAELEVQLGAFTIESLAEECVEEYKHLERDVYIKKLSSNEGKIFYTVRTGPFESLEQAEGFLSGISPDPDDKPWIMRADSMQPAKRKAQPERQRALQTSNDDPEAAEEKPEAAEKTEPEQQKKAAEKKEEAPDAQEGGLWGAAESDEASSDAEEAEKEKPARKTQGPDAQSPETSGGEAAAPAANQTVKELQQEVEKLKDEVQTLLDAREVRKELEATEEEKEEEEEDILSAAGRQYTLMQKGRLGVEYKLEYSYFAYDALREQNIIEHNSQHTITNTFTTEYPLKNNLTIEAVIPYVYKYDKVGTDQSLDTTDFGDVDFALNYQPFKSGGGLPSIIFRSVLTCPMGRSPYDINPDTELSTGSGGYSLQGSMSVSKAVDPIMVFGTLGYTYKHPIDDLDFKTRQGYTLEEYERGDTVEFSMGIGYSLSYITSLTLGYSYAYTFENERFYKEAEPDETGTRTTSSLNIGTSWRLSTKMRMNMSLGIGLANSDYYTLSFRFPYEFDL